MHWDDIIGNEVFKKKMKETVDKNRLAHAHTLITPAGSYGLALALGMANYLHCLYKKKKGNCKTCSSCKKSKNYMHPDTYFLFPIATTSQITTKELICKNFLVNWRNFLKEKIIGEIYDWSYYAGIENKQFVISKPAVADMLIEISMKPFESKYKIIIIWLPEYLHIAASNSLLKILEEPSKYTLFLLITHQVENILPTILSRTQQHFIAPLQEEEIIQVLTKDHKVDLEKAKRLASVEETNLNKLLQTLEEDDINYLIDLRNWLRYCYANDIQNLIKFNEKIHEWNKSKQKSFLQYSLAILRKILQQLFNRHYKIVEEHSEEAAFITKITKTLQLNQLEQLIKYFNKLYGELERNANPKMLYLTYSLKIIDVFRKVFR